MNHTVLLGRPPPPPPTHTLLGECLSGALQWQELIKIAVDIGFAPPILVESIVFDSDNAKLKEYLGNSYHTLIIT